MAAKEKKIVPPKLNKFMHPRNPYRTPPSFKKLATDYPEFRAHCSYDVAGKVHLDFKNPNGLRALTTCLLRQDFGLEVKIPEGRLVPTLPLRLNYLLWLDDLLSLAARRRGGGGGGGGGEGAMPVVGVDIGMRRYTGAACVYPLLGAAHLGWCMLGTETDTVSYSSATGNVERNDLSKQVIVRKVEEKTILKGAIDHPEILARVSALRPRRGGRGSHSSVKARGPSQIKSWKDICPGKAKEDTKGEEEGKEKKEDRKEEGKKEEQEEDKNGRDKKEEGSVEEGNRDYTYDFTMTNPPFFSSEEEADTMAKSKKGRGEPSAAPTGSPQEKVTEGGEVEFIRQMVEESQLLRDTVRIFTTLIGTKAHIRDVKKLVEAAKPTSSVFTEFCQGRTMRWGVAWTFAAGVSLAEVRSKKEMATNKPIVLLLPRSLMSVYSVPAAWSKVQGWLKALKVKIEVFKSSKYFVSVNVKAFKPTWLHQRRRRREKEHHHHQHNGKSTKEEDDKGETSKRRPEEEREEERENKRAKIATEEEELEMDKEIVNQDMEEEEEEELEEEEESKEEGKPADQEDTPGSETGNWGVHKKPTKGGLSVSSGVTFRSSKQAV
ncbi:U6 small nuclear RNA (adenine-(43)-N(6))-methyltransferase [Chionoecetes opilio]|uniref:U6 small nuclear RNA (adenine-(43)-N(6))-methyltransferase n=1 Tax=Chionoecetes opilio TaxID=41210 RepID=A0A8J5CQ64_CHIOP|nr:U6 small nuclear RNA (adenine-(43)-N(6))-methyltransferase [Chionoecetes opilio]